MVTQAYNPVTQEVGSELEVQGHHHLQLHSDFKGWATGKMKTSGQWDSSTPGWPQTWEFGDLGL